MERLKQLRHGKNMTQVQLARALNVAQETISGYETGKAVPADDILIKLADTLDTSIDYLLGRTDIKTIFPSTSLSSQEAELLTAFRKLNHSKKERAIGMVTGLYD